MNQSVGRSFEEEDGGNREISVYNVSGVLVNECYSVQNHFKTMVRPLKRLNRSGVCRLFLCMAP